MLRLLVAMVLVLSASVTDAEDKKVIPSGAKLFVSEIPEGLDGYIKAELLKKKVPVIVVLSPDNAEFIMTGEAQARKGSWHEGWLSANKDKSTGSVVIVSKAQPDQILWAEEAGDRSLWLGALARGGSRKVASRIVDRLKKVVGGR